MKKILCPLLAICILGGWLAAQTLDDVLARYYQAHGGLDKLRAVTASKMSGKLVVPAQGMALPVVRWQKAPDKLRVVTMVQEQRIVQAFDGRTAWWLNPVLAADAEEMPQEQGRLFREQAEFADPLVVFREKGYPLELLGQEDLEGKVVFKLKMIKSEGKEIFFYLDAESGVGLKSSLSVKDGDASSLVEIIYSDYRLVDGQLVPFAIENRTGGKIQARLVLETVEINPDMDDDIFAMPQKKNEPKTEEKNKKGGRP